MTSAVAFARVSFLALFVSAGLIGLSDDAGAQTNGAAQAEVDQIDVQPMNRSKMRLELLLSLVENELREASLKKTRLVSEQVKLTRERAELSAIGDQRRPAENARLDQIERRLGTIAEEADAVDKRLPEIAGELDGLQLRLDEVNGIVREEEAPDEEALAQEDRTSSTSEPSASVWLDGKRQVQEALVYLGGYNALIDGDFGPRTAQAVRVYQSSKSLDETGILTDEQERELLEEAQAQRSLYGVQTFTDEEVGYQLSYPTLLLSNMEETGANERRMTTKDGESELLITVIEGSEQRLSSLYEEAAAEYEIQYRRKRDDWFVLAGLVTEDRIIYDTVRQAEGKLVRARLSYPVDQRDLWSPFAVIMFNTFSPLPTS